MNGNNEYKGCLDNTEAVSCDETLASAENAVGKADETLQSQNCSNNSSSNDSNNGSYNGSYNGAYNGAYNGKESGNHQKNGYRNGYYGGGGYRAYGENHGRSSVLIIGIAGGTGSGKSTFTRELIRRFKGNVAVLSHDNYYKAHHDMSFEEREKINYDEPAAYDTELLVEHLDQLKNGQSVECPVYDFTIHDRSEETVRIRPNKVIIVEGILIFADEALCSLFDVRIFIDTDADVRLIRRIYRDTKRRKRSLESVLTQYMETVKPMHEKYVDPSRKRADMILPDGGKNLVALDMLFSRIRKHIDDCRYYSGNHKKGNYKKPYNGSGTDAGGIGTEGN